MTGETLTLPALIAAVTGLDGWITGLQRTWLDPDGSGKAPLADPRRSLGHLLGNGISLGLQPGMPVPVMAAGEGFETMASLRSVMPALPVAADIAAGERVRVMSHPSGYYFHMTDGIVARHSVADPDEDAPDAPRAPVLNITADIAEGASGGAVLDAAGNVVGVAQSYALAKNDDEDTAFKQRGAIPAAAILSRMKAE